MATVAALQNIAAEITAAPHNNNYTDLRTGVNDINDDQINATADIQLSKLSTGASDEIFSNSMENFLEGCFLSRDSDTVLSVSAGSVMINGKLRRNTSSTTNTPTLTLSKWNDVFVTADSAASTFLLEVIPNLATPGSGTATATNSRLIGSIFTDATTDLNQTIQYRPNTIMGWTWQVGSAASTMTIPITFGKTFISANDLIIQPQSLGARTTASGAPASVSDFNADGNVAHVVFATDITTTTFNLDSRSDAGTTFVNSRNFGYTWLAHGRHT